MLITLDLSYMSDCWLGFSSPYFHLDTGFTTWSQFHHPAGPSLIEFTRHTSHSAPPTSAMASSSANTSVPLHELIFQQFLHDVHHAYLLLHRAMALLPPTMIPNMEPEALPSTGVWDQPEGLLPHYSAQTNAYVDNFFHTFGDEIPIASPVNEEDKDKHDEQDYSMLPEPHTHVSAPDPAEIPDTCRFSNKDKTPAKRPKPKTTPKAPAKRQRRMEKTPPRSPSPTSTWTLEEKKKLRLLKADERSRYSWKAIASKLGKSVRDVTHMWKNIKDDSEWTLGFFSNIATLRTENSGASLRSMQTLSFSHSPCFYVRSLRPTRLTRFLSTFHHVPAMFTSSSSPVVLTFSQHHVTALPSWSILFQSRHGPRSYISATTFKIPIGKIYDHDDGLSVSSTPWVDSSWASTTQTHYFCVWPQANATTRGHQLILQHSRSPGRRPPFYTSIWRPVSNFKSDLPGLPWKLQGIWSSDIGCRHISTPLVDPSPEARLLPLHWHRPGNRTYTWWNAWPPRPYAAGLSQLVLPYVENSSTSQCLHCPLPDISMHYTSSRFPGHRLHGPSSSHTMRTSFLFYFIEISRPRRLAIRKKGHTFSQYRFFHLLASHRHHHTLLSLWSIYASWNFLHNVAGLVRSLFFRVSRADSASCHGNHSYPLDHPCKCYFVNLDPDWCPLPQQWWPFIPFVYSSHGKNDSNFFDRSHHPI